MQHYVKIIVEGSGRKWFAWFEASPEVAFEGDRPIEGIRRLLAHAGEEEFEEKFAIAAEDAPKAGHWEFLVPVRTKRSMPMPSKN